MWPSLRLSDSCLSFLGGGRASRPSVAIAEAGRVACRVTKSKHRSPQSTLDLLSTTHCRGGRASRPSVAIAEAGRLARRVTKPKHRSPQSTLDLLSTTHCRGRRASCPSIVIGLRYGRPARRLPSVSNPPAPFLASPACRDARLLTGSACLAKLTRETGSLRKVRITEKRPNHPGVVSWPRPRRGLVRTKMQI
jgi:hypothetical protein